MTNIKKKIPGLETPQEESWRGSTPIEQPPDGDERWYIPEAVTFGYPIKEVNEARQQLGYKTGVGMLQVLGPDMGADPGMEVALRFQKLDPETGMTVRDPKIVGGKFDKENNKFIPEKDITKGFYESNKRAEQRFGIKTDLRLREDPNKLEGQSGGGPESGY